MLARPLLLASLLSLAVPAAAQDDYAQRGAVDHFDDDIADPDAVGDHGGSLGPGEQARGEEAGQEQEEEEGEADGAGPVYEKPIAVALAVGYGLNLSSDVTADVNPFGLGFGARGGYSMGRIYVGGRLMIFLGSEELQLGAARSSANELLLALEGGYDYTVGDLVVRPGVALGLAVLSSELVTIDNTGMARSYDDSAEDLYIAPSVAVIYDLEGDLFVGGDAQLPIVLHDPDSITGFLLLASGGMRF
ncbi:MAG: hypothetical protein PVI30_04850 [Myxococcales bacterium]|jgi:hypothetical protein